VRDYLDVEMDEERPGGWSRPVRLWVVVAVAMFASIVVTTMLHVATRGGGQPAPCTVPAVVGVPEAEARLAVEAAKLTLDVEQRVSDPLVQPGAVAWQQPLAGVRVATGTPIRVKLSTGLPGSDGVRSGGERDAGLHDYSARHSD
jgi:beta-lactam-binding protein with PASTA domain